VSTYLIAGAAVPDSARTGIVIRYLRDVDRAGALEPERGGLPRLVTIEVTPEEVGPNALRLDGSSRAKLVAAGVDPDQVERELHGMQRGDRKLLADIVYGAPRTHHALRSTSRCGGSASRRPRTRRSASRTAKR
jgi:hypothetical protein